MSHLTSFVDDVSDVLIALLNEVLEEADGLSSHKIGITDKNSTGDNIDIHLAIVNKPKRTQDNTQKESLQNLLNEMFFDCASPVLIIQFQRNSHDENNKRTKVTYDAVQVEEKIEINCGGRRAEYSLLGFVHFKSNHYKVTCLNISNSVWHTYDDHLISKNDKNTISRLRKSDQVTTLIYTNYDSNQPAISTIPSTADQEKSMDQNTGSGNNLDGNKKSIEEEDDDESDAHSRFSEKDQSEDRDETTRNIDYAGIKSPLSVYCDPFSFGQRFYVNDRTKHFSYCDKGGSFCHQLERRPNSDSQYQVKIMGEVLSYSQHQIRTRPILADSGEYFSNF